MTENKIDVGRASEPERYVATTQTVWFHEAPAAPAEEQLTGLPEELRFAADWTTPTRGGTQASTGCSR
jgi:hypothetical protein